MLFYFYTCDHLKILLIFNKLNFSCNKTGELAFFFIKNIFQCLIVFYIMDVLQLIIRIHVLFKVKILRVLEFTYDILYAF